MDFMGGDKYQFKSLIARGTLLSIMFIGCSKHDDKHIDPNPTTHATDSKTKTPKPIKETREFV